MFTKGIVPEQVKHYDKLFVSQVRQFDAKIHAVQMEGFSISGVNPTAQGQTFVVPLIVIELSHV